MITRKQYMNGEATYREYYGQFVTPYIINKVVRYFGRTKLLQSTDEHLNDIPLAFWDALLLPDATHRQFKEAGDWVSLANQVCVNKEAARQYIWRLKPMKTIRTNYHSCTDYRGSRVSAMDDERHRVMLSWDNELNAEENHINAVRALCKKMRWTGKMCHGGRKDGSMVHVFINESTCYEV